jgi:hypothetical protein
MKRNLSTGTGLALLAGAIVAHALISRTGVDQQAIASASAAGAEPTVVGFAATSIGGEFTTLRHFYHRLWSDGTIEILFGGLYDPFGGTCEPGWPTPCGPNDWKAIPDAALGYACRTDIDGNRVVDAADLTLLLGAWGQAPGCEALPTISCTVGELR